MINFSVRLTVNQIRALRCASGAPTPDGVRWRDLIPGYHALLREGYVEWCSEEPKYRITDKGRSLLNVIDLDLDDELKRRNHDRKARRRNEP